MTQHLSTSPSPRDHLTLSPLLSEELEQKLPFCCVWNVLCQLHLFSVSTEISGVIASYRRCLPQIQLYGPTNVAPIINRVAEPAQREQSTGQATVRRKHRQPGTVLCVFRWCQGQDLSLERLPMPFHTEATLVPPLLSLRSIQYCWCSPMAW